MEDLDLCNIIEIDRIRKILINDPDLLSVFEILIIVCNRRINEEKTISKLPIETVIEPNLSDHSSDEDDD
jgi:hypothetical protein